MSRFTFFPVEHHFWSFTDYQAVVDLCTEVRPRRVLEFGPGSSTLALLEGGSLRVDTCESDAHWAATWEERLVLRFPTQVYLHRYTYQWPVPLSIPALDAACFDLALIDGPHTTADRPLMVRYALERTRVVVVPTEDEGRKATSYLRPILLDLGAEYGYRVEFRETGPVAGGFAVMTRVP